jgi:hypothetical protein
MRPDVLDYCPACGHSRGREGCSGPSGASKRAAAGPEAGPPGVPR